MTSASKTGCVVLFYEVYRCHEKKNSFQNKLSVISRHTVEIRKLIHFFLSGISFCNDARELFIRKANYVKELDLFKLRE